MEKIILLGCGGHALSILDIFESQKKWKILGFVGKETDIGKYINGYPVLGSDKDLPLFRKETNFAFVCIGHIGNINKRFDLVKKLEDISFKFPYISSKYSVVSTFSDIGNGSSIGHGAIINAGAKIGDHCIINTNAVIEHESIIEDFCHISTGVLINGGVRIGKGSFIGSGSIIREGISIPPYTVISCGKRIMGWPIKENQDA
tara:strand:- start:95 stop:703 length:609 start_codon:yes stop_codon:yes gene_type:complete